MARIIVTGSDGQLGRSLREYREQGEVRYLNRRDLDIRDGASLRNILKEEKPQWLINCAAYTAVDAAETSRALAFAINGEAVRTLAQICKETGTRLLHISTDYVFGGTGNLPHAETSVVHPEGIYAQSKRAGEVAVQDSGAGIVLRTSWLYSYFERNFFRTILRKCIAGESLRVVADQIGTPTWAGNLAQTIWHIVEGVTPRAGLYHYSDLGACSWYDFACYIRKLAGTNNCIEPIGSEEWKAAAPRPHFSLLDSRQSRRELNLGAMNWMEGVERCYRALLQYENGTYFEREYK